MAAAAFAVSEQSEYSLSPVVTWKNKLSEADHKPTIDADPRHPIHLYKSKWTYEGSVHKVDLLEIHKELQNDDRDDIYAYMSVDNIAMSQKLPHKFFKDPLKAMKALEFDPYLIKAEQKTTQHIQCMIW